MKSLFGKPTLIVLGIIAVLVAITGVVLIARILLVPFVVAMFVAYLFEPGIAAFERRGLGRGNAYLIFLGGFLLAVVVLLAFAPAWLLPEVAPSQQGFTDRISMQLSEVEKWAVRRAPMLRSMHLAEEVSTRSISLAKRLFEELPGFITSFTVNLLLVPFIAYFMVRDGRQLKRRIIEWVPNRYFEMSLIVFEKVDGQIGGYLRGRLIECFLVGVIQLGIMGILNAFLNVPQPQILFIALLCGVTNLIPYVGPAIGAAFGVFIYLGIGESTAFVSCAGFLAALAVTHVVDNVVIAPAVLSHNVDLHPLSVALVLVIGGELFGVLGLLIAIPVAASLKVIASEFYNNYQAQVR